MKKYLPLFVLSFGILLMLASGWQYFMGDNASSHFLSAEELPSTPNTALQSKDIQFPKAINQKSSLGINTNEIYEQDASIPFIDLFRVAAPFHENIRCRAKDKPCLTSASVEYDKQGWPKKLNGGKAGVFFIRNIHRDAFPKGEYTVLYEGEGKIEYLHNAKLVSRKPNQDTITLDARSDGFMTAALQIVESNPEKPLRKVRILMPGGICANDPFHQVANDSPCKSAQYLSFKDHHASILFNPDYLNFMKDFKVIRMMPMSGVTRNSHVKWSERPTLDKATWGGIYGTRGAPLEIQIELANRLKANPWLNVPHASDDDYIKQFAHYVKTNLDPSLMPYIEYTNEAWNSNFVHNEHMQKMGIAEKLDKDALMAGYKYYAKRSVEFFKIWGSIYAGDEKLVRVISGWDTRPDISGTILAYNDTYKHVDALAIAPYVGGNLRGFRESKTVDDIFKLLTEKASYRSLPKVIEEITKTAKLSKEFGVEMISYEGGQGLVDWATRDYMQHPNPLFFGANRDPRMKELYETLYSEWKKMGAGLFTAFASPRSCNADGCWGLKEHIRKPLDESPKLQASLEFIKDNPIWWDWSKLKKQAKPESSKVAHFMPSIDPTKPRIVIRPAKGDKETFHRLQNPQALNVLLEGKTWDKKDISGKWQVKWDDENLYLIVKAYDKEFSVDSDDPKQDDSVEFFIDGNNDGGDAFDKQNDFHFIFKRVSLNASNKFDGTERTKDGLSGISGKENPTASQVELPYSIKSKYDGYEMKATISWKQLGISPAVKHKLRMDVIINDDDDGGDRDARVGWNTRNIEPVPNDFGMILMSGR
jgi:hypothetical protein